MRGDSFEAADNGADWILARRAIAATIENIQSWSGMDERRIASLLSAVADDWMERSRGLDGMLKDHVEAIEGRLFELPELGHLIAKDLQRLADAAQAGIPPEGAA